VEPSNQLLSEREANEAYLAARPGEAYALFFTNGGAVALDLRNVTGRFDVRWIDIATGEWGKREVVEGGGQRRLAPPGNGLWVAALKLTNAKP
jgi:hypothetical protein